MEEEKVCFLALNFNFTPPNKKVFFLYQKYKSFKKIFQELEKDFKIKKDWEKEYQRLKNLGGKIILRKEKEFPDPLKKIKPPVLGIFILGNLNLNFPLKISIVGTRKASSVGKKIAFNFAKELSDIGVLIISGLAYGIDENAHLGAISVQKPNIAVLGYGLDIALKTRKNLVEKILAVNGLIITEYHLGSPGKKEHFPLRNRIIAGLSDGILVIEAPIDSGALITARYGLEYGKEIFVIPGDIYEKNYLGSLKLIQQGANLVIEPEDILRAFDFQIPQKIKNLSLSPKEKKVYEILKIKPLTFQEILEKTKMPANDLLATLTFLEMKGLIQNNSGKFLAL